MSSRLGELLARPSGAVAGPFDPSWDGLLVDRDPHWPRYTDVERERMEHLVGAFMARTRWESARGFTLDTDMKVLVAAQACVLLLGLDHDEFGGPSRVIVHPSTVVLRGRRSVGVGRVETSDSYRVLGQAHHRGPVLLSWASVRSGLAHPRRGQNVVYHEFAHQLDMLDGTVDGTPPLHDDDARQRWIDVCTESYHEVRDPAVEPAIEPGVAVEPNVLRAYAGTNPGEFFAVATEVFFTRPHELRRQHGALYRELVGYYRQDPSRRFPDPHRPEQEHPSP
jgi:MtfA peptidase